MKVGEVVFVVDECLYGFDVFVIFDVDGCLCIDECGDECCDCVIVWCMNVYGVIVLCELLVEFVGYFGC